MRRITVLIFTAVLGLTTLLPDRGRAERATRAEMEGVCRNWLSYIVHETGGWAGASDPQIVGTREILDDGVLLGRSFSIAPRGHIVVPILKQLPPIKAYSEDRDLDVDQRFGFPQLLREILRHRVDLYIEQYGSLDASQPDQGAVLLGREHRQEWDRFLIDPETFQEDLRRGAGAPMTEIGPLLTTAWHQGSPYNNFCPMGDGGRCVVGCVATAAAQIMNYHEWPPRGIGDHSYFWDGDQSCGGNTGGEWLYADFTDPYDWDQMPDDCGGGCSQEEQDALAELSYEAGVAFDMDYGACGSGTYTSNAVTAFPTYFRYDPSIEEVRRNTYSAESWFALIQEEINSNRPMLYAFRYDANSGHAIVCDGWRDTGGQNQYHMNYGWGGPYTDWYTIDNIYHTYNPNDERLIRNIEPGTGFIFEVRPDGTGDYATIQAAIDDVLEGDIVELTDGVFQGDGNRDLDLHGKAITVRSRSGNPSVCIIDCEGNPDDHRGFQFVSGEGASSIVEGITIRNGFAATGGRGGGILCSNGSSPTIRNCVITGCSASAFGGGIACVDSDPTIVDCTLSGNGLAGPASGGGLDCAGSSPTISGCIFSANTANDAGGGIALHDAAHPTLSNCTISGNEATGSGGGGIWLASDSSIELDHCIIAFGVAGGAVACEGGSGDVVSSCCDIYGNGGGDWVGCIADQLGVDGNISEDPLFCDLENEDFHLQADSPCAQENNPECGLIGALPLGCGSYLVRPDGTGDFPTIQAAIDAAVDGDLIELASGTFTGEGNRDIDYLGKRITIRSQSDDPDSCIIDCQGNENDPHRGFDFHSGEWPTAVLRGVTITNGYMPVYGGGAIRCTEGSSPTIENCIVRGNYSETSGGGLYANASQPTLSYCTFCDNTADNGGAAAYSNGEAISIDHCTFSNNSAGTSAGGIFSYRSTLTVENSIISFSTQGEAFHCFYSEVTLLCSDVYGNAGGDWVDCIEGQEGINGNFCGPPWFCDPENGDFRLSSDSPCAAENNPECGQIGAWPVGCPPAAGVDAPGVVATLRLAPAAPNPFHPQTRIAYVIPSGRGAARVMLSIHDPAGRLVRMLVDGPLPPGVHSATWDGKNGNGSPVAAGIYFCQLRCGAEKQTRRLVLVR